MHVRISYIIVIFLIIASVFFPSIQLKSPTYNSTKSEISHKVHMACSGPEQENFSHCPKNIALDYTTLISENVDIHIKKYNILSLVYEASDEVSGNLIDTSYVEILELPVNILVKWRIIGDTKEVNDEYILNNDFSTRQWKVKDLNEQTDYKGIRLGNTINIQGLFHGKLINKTFSLDDLPLYYNPKIGLMNFVKSDENKMEFWALRHDTLKKHKMKALKLGTQIVQVNGQSVACVKVYWAAKGIGEKYFNRTYYYRVEDGLFVKQDVVDGWSLELEHQS